MIMARIITGDNHGYIMHQVLYDSRGGNTKKVAEAIVGELNSISVISRDFGTRLFQF